MTTRLPYLFGLDAIRLAAALIVAAFHLSWLDPATATDAAFGWVGVEIFFVISGFVIANSSENVRPFDFVRSRFLRLYPAAWICALLSFLVMAANGTFALQTVPATLLLVPVGPTVATAYWTLPVELAFYALVLLLLSRGKQSFLPALGNALATASCAYLFIYACSASKLRPLPWLEFDYGWKNMSLLRHGVFFSLGIAMWMWSRNALSDRGKAAAGFCVLMGLIEIGCRSAELVEKSPAELELWQMWVPAGATWLASLLLMAGAIRWRTEIAALPTRFLSALRVGGLTTYPLYLLHEVHGGAAREQLLLRGIGPHASVALAVIVSVALAAVIAILVEPPVRNAVANMLGRMANSRSGAAGINNAKPKDLLLEKTLTRG